MKTFTWGLAATLVLLLQPGYSSAQAPQEKTAERSHSADCNTLSASGTYPNYEPLPRYVIARRESSADHKITFLYISTSPSGAGSLTALIRLACDLAEKFRTDDQIQAFVFDSKEAAKNIAFGFEDQRRNGEFLWHYRTRIKINRALGLNSLDSAQPRLDEDGLLNLAKYHYQLTLPR